MGKKWSNLNLPGALHFITGNVLNRRRIFNEQHYCVSFLDELNILNQKWPSKLIAYVVMPDHFHMISNPRDGRIREFVGAFKSLTARRILRTISTSQLADGRKLWQESFKALPLWSDWMTWQKINYIHANPVKAGLVRSAKDYRWSSFRSYYSQEEQGIGVHREWWWPDDAEKLSQAVKQLGLRR